MDRARLNFYMNTTPKPIKTLKLNNFINQPNTHTQGKFSLKVTKLLVKKTKINKKIKNLISITQQKNTFIF